MKCSMEMKPEELAHWRYRLYSLQREQKDQSAHLSTLVQARNGILIEAAIRKARELKVSELTEEQNAEVIAETDTAHYDDDIEFHTNWVALALKWLIEEARYKIELAEVLCVRESTFDRPTIVLPDELNRQLGIRGTKLSMVHELTGMGLHHVILEATNGGYYSTSRPALQDALDDLAKSIS